MTEIAKSPTGIMKNIEAVYINAHRRYFPASTPQNFARQIGNLLVMGTRKKKIIPKTLKRVWLIETWRAGRNPAPAFAKAAITPKMRNNEFNTKHKSINTSYVCKFFEGSGGSLFWGPSFLRSALSCTILIYF